MIIPFFGFVGMIDYTIAYNYHYDDKYNTYHSDSFPILVFHRCREYEIKGDNYFITIV